MELTYDQCEVLDGLIEFATGDSGAALAVLSGYAGVGKTTVVGELVRRVGPDLAMAVAAPTHKAVSVLREKIGDETGVEFKTIHSLLGLRMVETPDGRHDARPEGESSLHAYQFVIVDECSLIDQSLFSSILMRRGRCRVLFVGDPAQLAPVNSKPGEISPAFGPQVRVRYSLTEVVRQARANPIIRVATMARERITTGQTLVLDDIRSILKPEDDDFMCICGGGLDEVANMTASAVESGMDVRAITHTNNSVLALNRMVHQRLRPGSDPWVVGVPVIAQSEFAMRGRALGDRVRVKNSDLLTVVSAQDEAHEDDPGRPAWKLELELASGARGSVYVPQDQDQWRRDFESLFGSFRRMTVEANTEPSAEKAQKLKEEARKASSGGWALKNRYADIRHAYAMTAHKAQGSTFDAVVLDWSSMQRCPDIGARARLVYVALTRTSKFSVICA